MLDRCKWTVRRLVSLGMPGLAALLSACTIPSQMKVTTPDGIYHASRPLPGHATRAFDISVDPRRQNHLFVIAARSNVAPEMLEYTLQRLLADLQVTDSVTTAELQRYAKDLGTGLPEDKLTTEDLQRFSRNQRPVILITAQHYVALFREFGYVTQFSLQATDYSTGKVVFHVVDQFQEHESFLSNGHFRPLFNEFRRWYLASTKSET